MVEVFEVGPRDGLQNESRTLELKDKLWFIEKLAEAGIHEMEVGAFVRPDRVPQMEDTDRIFSEIRRGSLKLGRARVWSLVPNRKGLSRALAVGSTNIAVFTAATESFAQRNIGMSIQESLNEFAAVIQESRNVKTQPPAPMRIRGYVSTAFGCPFEGKVSAKQSLTVIEKLADMGVGQISIGDTIGVATPLQVTEVVGPALRLLGPKKVAVHFHDTRGTALANTLRALDLGVEVIDSSAGGLGGCPFAPGASGNLATEDLVYMLHGMGLSTGIQLEKLREVSLELARRMSRPISSRYLQACANQRP